ncbi:hypothetical protein ADUPG1_013717 [Aduncisulcus paluster]|uniref:Uncharacterized protein n=1 Tax=Aduncisulcus paluster TaxID=2918883 RepID=A0ABQ5K7V8_9EUKA|nr:hypothetical protein ADUPG1_013717 [Aduncisulcus paluster]
MIPNETFVAKSSTFSTSCTQPIHTSVKITHRADSFVKWGNLFDPPIGMIDPRVYQPSNAVVASYPDQRLAELLPRFLEGSSGIAFKTIAFPFGSPFSCRSIYICISSEEGNHPKQLEVIFETSEKQSIKKLFSMKKIQGYTGEWRSLRVGVENITHCTITCKESWVDGNDWCWIDGIRFVRDERESISRAMIDDHIRLSSLRESRVISGDTMHQPRSSYELVYSYTDYRVIHPLEYEARGSFACGYDAFSIPSLLIGDGSAFKSIFLPFSRDHSIGIIYICLWTFHEQPKDLDISFHTIGGKMIHREYRIPKIEQDFEKEDNSYSWIFLLVDVSNVIACTLECLGSWHGFPWCYIQGIQFILSSDEAVIARKLAEHRDHIVIKSILTESNPLLKLPSHVDANVIKINKHQATGVFPDGHHPIRVRRLVEEDGTILRFVSLFFPFLHDHSLDYLYLCINQDVQAPKDIDLILSTTTGAIFRKQYRIDFSLIPLSSAKARVQWHVLPINVNGVVSCEIECISSWRGSQFADICGIRFVMKKREANALVRQQSIKDLSLPRPYNVISVFLRDIIPESEPIKRVAPENASIDVLKTSGEFPCFGSGDQPKELDITFILQSGREFHVRCSVIETQEWGLTWHVVDISGVRSSERIVACRLSCVSSWNGNDWCTIQDIRFILDVYDDSYSRKKKEFQILSQEREKRVIRSITLGQSFHDSTSVSTLFTESDKDQDVEVDSIPPFCPTETQEKSPRLFLPYSPNPYSVTHPSSLNSYSSSSSLTSYSSSPMLLQIPQVTTRGGSEMEKCSILPNIDAIHARLAFAMDSSVCPSMFRNKQPFHFYSITFPFSHFPSIQAVNLLLPAGDDSPQEIDIICVSEDDDGTIKANKYEYFTSKVESSSVWHSLPLSTTNIRELTLKCLRSWAGNSWCDVEQVVFIESPVNDESSFSHSNSLPLPSEIPHVQPYPSPRYVDDSPSSYQEYQEEEEEEEESFVKEEEREKEGKEAEKEPDCRKEEIVVNSNFELVFNQLLQKFPVFTVDDNNITIKSRDGTLLFI